MSRTVVWCALITLAAGCSSPKHPLVPVEGKIAFSDGKALPAGTRLVFNPVEGGAQTAVGVVNDDSSISVVHAWGKKGAEIGKYTVALLAPEQDASFYQTIPKEYFDSGGAFSVEVKEGMQPLELRVKRKKK